MKIKTLLPLMAMLCFSIPLIAQNKSNVNFGKVSIRDFSLDNIKVDTSYGAVVLADVGKSVFVGNKKGYFSLVYKHQRRVLILNPKGFDIATVNIPLYKSRTDDREETLLDLKATTYNSVDGKVVETKLDKDNVFKEVISKTGTLRKFTLPAVKEGSIIEYSYTIESDFLFNLQPWKFQGSYPRLWSEYELLLPEFFEYVFLSKGYHPFHIKEVKEKFESFYIRVDNTASGGIMASSNTVALSSNSSLSRWVMKDVPAIIEESFTSSIDNHISQIEFQASGRKFPDMPRTDIMGNWTSLANDLLKRPDFGAELRSDNIWLEETLQNLDLNGKDSVTKAKIIYDFVRKNYSSLGNNGIYISQTPRETFRTKKGYVADLNMLLTIMLLKAGLDAEPVILSTRSNGLPTDTYPLINQYNYHISKFFVGNEKFYLDASSRSLGFGKLKSYCYNGAGVGISLFTSKEELYPEATTEKKVTNVIMINGQDKNKWTASFSSYLGYNESTNIREEVTEKGKEAFSEKIKKSYTGEWSVFDVKIDNLDESEKSILMNYMLELDRGDDDNNIIYFNPMLKEGLKENYFKSMERSYPVELPYKMDETFLFQLQIPEGYVVDELPKSVKVSLNEADGGFEYLISKSATDVTLRTRLHLENTLFLPEDYETLREFFDYVVKKHAEQIVFKKK
jgi:hypothetical protein